MAEIDNPRPIMEDDEITFRDLVLKLRGFFFEILRFWYIPAIVMLITTGYMFYQYTQYRLLYPAKITFNVDEDEGGGVSGLSSILGQFGLGSVRPTRYNLDKILALSKSRRVIQETLLAKITVNGQEDKLANQLIKEYKLGLPGGPANKPFRFTHDSVPDFTMEENEMLLALYNFIIGPPDKPKKALMIADYNEDSNIMTISVTTTNEDISFELAKRMFESLSQYYINKAIEKQLKTYNLVTAKRDSVLGVLKSAEFQLANFKDTHRDVLMRTDQLTDLRLQREVTTLSAMYAEVLKNVEIADFSLKNKTPFIQVIDSPLLPIEPLRKSLLRTLLLGLIIGGAIGSVLVIGRKLWKDSMSGVHS
ncbi:MAG TPA: GNVR domain-containing protein [Saprospiraceae bacterium]|nr:GNVR domain-containing protein [Saprospiraceae bacterium]